ncbi:lipase family alpha/beta hydrolase [uncultured Jatrophihabitans sp.]|uniref:lipase family alpha/beta hydrolase n=1 Tax=uncultured Jatrophihabitans sp. TaxID=1610747 RepID=UPI0035CA8A26
MPSLRRESDFVPSAAAREAEMRSYRAFVGLLRRPVRQPAHGVAVPVVLVPGFISGDVSLTILARELRRSGHRTFGSRIGANLGCTDAMVDRLVHRLAGVVAAEGCPVAVVGHSRGGMIVKLAAQRRPDLVAGIVVLAAPVTGTLRVATHVRAQLELLFRLNRRGVGSVMSEDCVTGECAARIAAELVAPFPAGVQYTSVYSESDAIIDWHTCLDPAAECVAVASSHTGMGTDPAVRQIVAERLARLEVPDRG